MNIVEGVPPNFDAIVARFPDAGRKGIIFTYGEDVYVNGVPELPIQLVAHEQVHIEQQAYEGVAQWWKRYLNDGGFRYTQELAAHRAEYRVLVNISKRLGREHLRGISNRLASPLYGGVVSFKVARRAIRAVA